MAKRKDIEIAGDEAAAKSEMSELPIVESPSPSLSPAADPAPAPEPAAIETPIVEPIVVTAPIVEPKVANPASPPRFVLRPRHKRYALLAATVTFAAALGAVVGALASGGFSAPAPAKPDMTAIEENKAMQRSLAKLGKEVTALKASLEAANKAAHTQMAKISERLEHASAEITGSISPPQTTTPALAPAPAPTPMAAPLPSPRPRVAAAEIPPQSGRPQVLAGWTIHDMRGGYVFVEN
ncbi:MAG: hypothetical protein ACREB2_13200, partial [Pseudolabrys sp.]